MKKLSLEQTWRYCLKMWKWIALKYIENPQRDVHDLKVQWSKENGLESPRESYCLFCQYAADHENVCGHCPGCLVDPDFSCFNTEYDWEGKPLAFYQELLRLNQIRKQGQQENHNETMAGLFVGCV